MKDGYEQLVRDIASFAWTFPSGFYTFERRREYDEQLERLLERAKDLVRKDQCRDTTQATHSTR